MDSKRKQEIKDAVARLDPDNDDHWTQSGLPAMPAMQDAIGGIEITRADVTEATGGADRDNYRNAPHDEGGGEPDPNAVDDHVDGAPTAPASVGGFGWDANAEPDGPEPDVLFAAMEFIASASSAPRYQRNSGFAQIRRLWQNDGPNIRRRQEMIEAKLDRQADRREAEQHAATRA